MKSWADRRVRPGSDAASLTCRTKSEIMHLSMLSPRVGGVGRATHGVLTAWSVPKVGILTWPPSWIMKRAWKSTRNVIIALLLCASRSEGFYFGHLYSLQGGGFWYFWPIMLSRRWGIWPIFSENVKIPIPCPTPPSGLNIDRCISNQIMFEIATLARLTIRYFVDTRYFATAAITTKIKTRHSIHNWNVYLTARESVFVSFNRYKQKCHATKKIYKWNLHEILKVTVYLQRCLASKRCNTSVLNCRCLNPYIKLKPISNGNRTEWSTIQGVIGRVISNQPSV